MAKKNLESLPAVEQTLIPPIQEDPENKILELDEMWTFVFKKDFKMWLWVALSRETRQIVAYFLGDRSESSCRQLWEKVPESYREGDCYTDCLNVYQEVIPAEQHFPCRKKDSETNHIERWFNTLRQRLARVVRKTLSFSKSHTLCMKFVFSLLLFIITSLS